MRIKKQNVILSLVSVLFAVLCKIFQFAILPQKYFYDSRHILAVMNGSNNTDISYSFTASFYKKINIFQINDIYSWSIYITIIATLAIAGFFLFSKKEYSGKELLFIFASLALLNIYVFNLSKEVIQLLIFVVVYLIIQSRATKNAWIKIILCSIIFMIESIFFRTYYLILAAMTPIVYMALGDRNRQKRNAWKVLLTTILLFFLVTYVAGLISPEGLNSILSARSMVNDIRTKDADSMIIELFGRNTNFLVFCANYLVDFIRLLLPLELVAKSIKYIPFVIYQIALTMLIFRTIALKRDDKNNMLLAVIIGFVCISAIFEPDFGSFVRHQACVCVEYAAIMTSSVTCSTRNNKTSGAKR